MALNHETATQNGDEVATLSTPRQSIGFDDVSWGSLGFPMLMVGVFFGIDLWLQSPTLISFPVNLLGVPLIVLGLSLTSWSFKTILATPRNAVLVTSGPWAQVRHPIYLTGFIVNLGCAIIIGTATLFIGLIIQLLLDVLVSVFIEERRLKKKLPGEYEEYANQVPRWIPRNIRLRFPGRQAD